MKGLAKIKQNEMGWVEKETPECGPFDAIVRPLALSPCTLDVNVVWGDAYASNEANRIIGHEAVGVIEEVGEKLKGYKPGDRVIVPSITPQQNRLPSQLGFGRIDTCMTFMTSKDGTFAEQFHVNDADLNLAHLPDSVSLEQAIMISDMMDTGFYGAELAEINYGDTVVVLDTDPIGLMSIAGANCLGASRIFAVGDKPATFKVAKEYGATDIIDYSEGNVIEQILDLTDGKGVDKAIVIGGDLKHIGRGLSVLRNSGTLGCVLHYDGVESMPVPDLSKGIDMGDELPSHNHNHEHNHDHEHEHDHEHNHEHEHKHDHDHEHEHHHSAGTICDDEGCVHSAAEIIENTDKKIRGGVCTGGKSRIEQLIKLVQYGRIDSSKLITHKFTKFEDIEKAMRLMKDNPEDLIKTAVILE